MASAGSAEKQFDRRESGERGSRKKRSFKSEHFSGWDLSPLFRRYVVGSIFKIFSDVLEFLTIQTQRVMCSLDETAPHLRTLAQNIIVTTSALDESIKAAVMEACCRLDFTVRGDLDPSVTTHLVTDSVLTEKYHVAVAHQLPVVRAEWILHSKERGKLEPEEPYLLLAFHKLQIALTGTGLGAQARARIAELVDSLGGRLSGSLTPEATHLVANSAHGEKFRGCCAGFNHQLAHVRVVACGWLETCARTGICIDEASYRMAWPEPPLSACVVHLARLSASDAQQTALVDAARRAGATMVRRVSPMVTHILLGDVAAADLVSPRWCGEAKMLTEVAPTALILDATWLFDCELASVEVPTAPYLWRGLAANENLRMTEANGVAGRGGACMDAARGKIGSSRAALRADASCRCSGLPDDQPSGDTDLRAANDAHASHTTANGPARRPADGLPGRESSLPTPAPSALAAPFADVCLLRVLGPRPSSELAYDDLDALLAKAASAGMVVLRSSEPDEITKWCAHRGRSVVLAGHGENEARLAQDAIAKHEVMRECNAGQSQGGTGCDRTLRPAMVVQSVSCQWLEACVQCQELIPPARYPIYKPCQFDLPLAAFRSNKVQLSVTQYEREERMRTIELAKMLGARYCEAFKRYRTHLLTPACVGDKCQKAFEWGVPMVSAEWLKDCWEAGDIVPINEFHKPTGQMNQINPILQLPLSATSSGAVTWTPAPAALPRSIAHDGGWSGGGNTEGAAGSRQPWAASGEGLSEESGPQPVPARSDTRVTLSARANLHGSRDAARQSLRSGCRDQGRIARSDTVTKTEALLAELVSNEDELEACEKGQTPFACKASLALSDDSNKQRAVRRSDIHSVVRVEHACQSSTTAQVVHFVDPVVRDEQHRLRLRLLERDGADTVDSPEPLLSMTGLADKIGGTPGGVGSIGRAATNPFAVGSIVPPLSDRTLVIVGSSTQQCARLAASAQRLGAQVVGLCDDRGAPVAVPLYCSHAVFADTSSLADSYECLAVLAAGLSPLRPSFLDACMAADPDSVATLQPAPEHEWSSLLVAGRERLTERASRLLAVARGRARTRLLEGWRFKLHASATTALDAPGSDLSQAQARALLLSGGARLLAADEDADDATWIFAAGHAAEPLYGDACELDSILRCVRGEVEPSGLLDAVSRASPRLAPRPEVRRAAVAEQGVRHRASVGSKRQTRHSAAPDGKRRR